MAEVVRIAAPRPSLNPLFFSAVCIGAAGFLLWNPEGLDPASILYLFSSLLAFKVGLVRIYVAVSGVPLRPVYAQRLTQVVAAASIAALLLAPPPARFQPAGTPAPVPDLVTGRPKPLSMYNLPSGNTVVGHLESLLGSTVRIGSLVKGVPDRVTGSHLPSFVGNALNGNNEATEDVVVCAVPSLPNIALLPLFCEMENRGEGVKEAI
ncbi:hypothetical protein COCNU_03G004400 [Cocos nucifera]|uniref:Uncharacterized protein n=1 Tax=Cocos nucifera TaxID=13894 RepID=A0A8K0I2H3_COCNU|nr:hypothetical protein COCNU_03G004400 [Cocos nucifera]